MDTRKLYRSQNDRIIAGVCGGIGHYLHLDSTLIRLVFILLFFLGFHGLLAYIIMWIVVPAEPLLVVEQSTGSENKVDIQKPTEEPAPAELTGETSPKRPKKKPASKQQE